MIGWWLAKDPRGTEGWAPSAYLQEEAPPPVVRHVPPPPPAAPAKPNGVNGAAARAKAKPNPPAPPAKRPVAAGRKPAPPSAPRDSGMSIGANGSGGDSGRSTPTPSLAGGLAEALRARQSAMSRDRDDDDDW